MICYDTRLICLLCLCILIGIFSADFSLFLWCHSHYHSYLHLHVTESAWHMQEPDEAAGSTRVAT